MPYSLRICCAATFLCSVLATNPVFAQQNTADKPVTTREAIFTGNKPPTTQPEWADQIKHPVPWFTWGADSRNRIEMWDNGITLNRKDPDDDQDMQRFRMRLWATVAPTPQFEFNVRAVSEPKHYCLPESKPNWDWQEVIFDNLNFKLKPADWLTLTVGRQDIGLGEGWLVFDGTPLDGSRTFFFDAIRGTVDLKQIKTTVDGIFIYDFARSDTWLPPINDRHKNIAEQDERGAILWVTNKSIPDTEVDPYFIYKHDKAVAANGDQGEIYAFGNRMVHDFNQHWRLRDEGAYEFGRRNDAELSAWGTLNRLSYRFNDKYKNELRLNYEFLSGDNPNNARNTAFDPLWGRWPQWSDLLIYTVSNETRVSEWTNLHRIGPGWQVEPTSKMSINTDYALLFAPQNTFEGRAGFSDSGHFRGQLFSAILRYKFNRFMSGHIMSELFLPGNYYDESRQDPATWFRAELTFTF
jgi:hypothetical protein